ncbi:PLDc N-terminal domain-containing protein [Aeromicrobium chenweiae]|uniref:Uncharacterized protein n=1 Tax=Aeromicrobium chenweiae TaxID=2079793 RepID=A0A2S0WM63_9ACTN|nr:PLD nuclease N-terminal domain-containing protein [Aeromicrobium chenweiae]AWB92397.1 hypothetical protein C3E78_09385 [Aeromicrobium chenweiae]TGN31317.1 PLDc_N domain-containing protein [Aeromicrobium chenweiae]
MLYLDGVLTLVVLLLWIFCLIDVITTDESVCRNLGKTVWLLLVLFLPAIGSIAWLVAGRPQATPDLPYKGNSGPAFPEYERPGRYVDPDPERDAAYLQSLRDRAEQQRRAYQERKRRALGDGDQPSP